MVDGTTGRFAQGRVARARWCAVLAALCVTGVAAVYVVAVRTFRGQVLETTAMNGRAVQPKKLGEAAQGLLGTVSVASLAILMAIVLSVALIRRNVRLAGVVAFIVAGSIVTTEVLKLKLLRRPQLNVYGDPTTPFNTLPSGHTTVAMCVVVALILVVPRRSQGIVALLGAPYPIGIGIATVIAGWHRPSDVLAGCLVVGAWTFGGLLVLNALGAMEPEVRRPWERFIAPAIVVGLVLSVIALATTTLYGVRIHYRPIGVLGSRGALKPAIAFGFSTASIATVATLIIGSLLWILRDVRLGR